MTAARPVTLTPADAAWPPQLSQRLGTDAPPSLHAIGPLAHLAAHKTALFCSARAPGAAILPALDTARRLRDAGVTVISGFHSPLEQECLAVLLRGEQPIVVCPARAIETMRIPSACRVAYDAGRMLFLSPFTARPVRVTATSACRRNQVVAALAADAYIAHITPGGHTQQIADMLARWHVPLL